MVKIKIAVAITVVPLLFSCNPDRDKSPASFAPKVVEALGYVVPQDSIIQAKWMPFPEPTVVRAGKPKVVPVNTNVHPGGYPKVVMAGEPRINTPGQDGFLLPQRMPVVGRPVIADIPEVVLTKEAFTRDQNPHNFISFGKLQGLRSSQINCLLEDKNGNLWIGNSWGVSKYDGKSFTHYSEKDGLSSLWITCMLEDKSGNLWFGTYDAGITKYDGKRFTHFSDKEGLGKSIKSILQDKRGNYWFGSWGEGVIQYEESGEAGPKATHFTEKEGLSSNLILCMLEDESGNLWIGSARGLTKYDGKHFTHYTEKEGLSNNAVSCLLQDSRGHLWLGTDGGGVNKFDASGDSSPRFTHYTEKEGLGNNYVTSIREDKQGQLWFGTNGGGVSKFQPGEEGGGSTEAGSFIHFTEAEGLSDNRVSAILMDKRGHLWLGTERGVNKYGGKSFTHFTVKEGLSGNSVRSILQDKSGNLWFGTITEGANKYDGKSFTHLTTREGMRINTVKVMLGDKNGNLWFGDWGGLSKYDGTSFTYYTTGTDMSTSMLQDKSGRYWFGSFAKGVFQYDASDAPGTRFKQFTTKEGLSGNLVSVIFQDIKGHLWFGTDHGVTKYEAPGDKEGRFIHFTEKEGLSNNAVFSILEDKYGNVWMGTKNGLNKFDGEKFTLYTEREGLSNNLVLDILEDKRGNLWFSTRFGLNKLAADKITSGLKDSEFLFKTYTYEDGFAGIDVYVGKSLFEARDGTIWIGAGDRLTAFHPGEDIPDTLPPNIQLTGLTLFNENIAWRNLEKNRDTSIVLGNGVRFHDFHFDSISKWYGIPEHLSLAYNNNNLTFQFVGITIQSPKKVKYKVKLEGLDENWSVLTNRNEAPYGNLPHGRYTFKVKAMNGDGYWSNELDYVFTIRPPWWLTWWAYSLYGLLLLASGVLIYRFQKKRIIRIEQQKSQEKELEQAKEIEKAYKELKTTQAQLIQSEKMASLGELTAGIAHEIQNPLNFVNNFSEVSNELINEMNNELEKGDVVEAKVIASDIQHNLEKIHHHGKRADAIVKGMLQHSRSNSGVKEPTDINKLADEYLRLAYHGFRAKDNNFNAIMNTDYDESLGKINIVPQEIGRVLLNLYNNAFYSVTEKKKQLKESYEPTVSVSINKVSDGIEIHVKDNGIGVPPEVVDKIFQPFFTTKPTGQGSGLGLSLSYDIVRAHGGSIKVKSFNSPKDGASDGSLKVGTKDQGSGEAGLDQMNAVRTEFIVSLPV